MTPTETEFNLGPIIQETLAEVEDEIALKALEMRREDLAILWLQKGTLLGLSGQHDQKQIAWQKAHKLDPDNPVIRQRLQS